MKNRNGAITDDNELGSRQQQEKRYPDDTRLYSPEEDMWEEQDHTTTHFPYDHDRVHTAIYEGRQYQLSEIVQLGNQKLASLNGGNGNFWVNLKEILLD